MEQEYAARETKYRIGKYILRLMVIEGLLNPQQFALLRDQLIDQYQPIRGELERGIRYED